MSGKGDKGAETPIPARRSPGSAARSGWLLCAIVGLVAFLPSLWGEYPLDDAFVARAVDERGRALPLVGTLGSLQDYFTTHWWHGYYRATELFRPITKLSLAWTHAAFGGFASTPAFCQHAVNLLLYSWCCGLVFACVERVVGLRAAWIAGLIFAVHAIHAEAVCTLTGRAEVLGLAFGLQGTLLLLAATRSRLSIWRCLLASLCFFAAFASKESALGWVPASFAILAFVRGTKMRGLVAWLVVLTPAVASFFVLRAQMIAQLPEAPAPTTVFANPLVALDTAARAFEAVEIFGFGIGRILCPLRLSADYGTSVFTVGDAPLSVAFWLSLAGLLALGSLALILRRSLPGLALGCFLYACFAFLTSNFAFAIGTIFGERLLFGPSFGAVVALGAVGAALLERYESVSRRWIYLPLALWLVYSAVYSVRRSVHFESTDTIALHDVQVQPRSANLQRLASEAYLRDGDRGAAIEALEAAVRLDPSFAASWLNLAALRREAGDKTRAEDLLREGLREAAPSLRRERAMLHASLATSLAGRGAKAEAIAELRKALELDPGNQDFAERLRRLR